MTLATTVAWSDRLARMSFLLVASASVFGMVAGAVTGMYWGAAPDIVSRVEPIETLQFLFFVVAVLLGLPHLILAAWDVAHREWAQAAMRLFAFAAPVTVFLGTQGLLSHLLWWEPISDTGRFHLLHHSLAAAAPLTLLYALLMPRLWRPAAIRSGPSTAPALWWVNGLFLLVLMATWGIADSVERLHPVQGPLLLVVLAAGIAADVFLFLRRAPATA